MEDLRRMRKEAGLTQVGLAKASGVDRATINKVEQGKRSPSIETLEKLARALGAEIGDFFPKVQAPLFAELPSGGASEQRRRYPYDWMSGALAELIDIWEERVERRDSPALSRSIAISCSMAAQAIIHSMEPVETWGSGEFTNEGLELARPEYLAFREEWWALEDRLYGIAYKGLKHYEEACGEAEAADEIRKLRELRAPREAVRAEIHRVTREMSA